MNRFSGEVIFNADSQNLSIEFEKVVKAWIDEFDSTV